MLNNVGDRTPPCGTTMLNLLSFESVPYCIERILASFYVVCYELNDDIRNVFWCEFVYVHCIKRLAHFQRYSYRAFWIEALGC